MDDAHRYRSTLRGLAASVTASVLFAAIFLLAGIVDASAEVVFGWRVLLTLACYAAALLWPGVRVLYAQFWRELRTAWWKPLLFLGLSGMVGVQLWLFAWAPANGHALDASLGFLLMPISLVLGGRFLLGDRVSPLQWTAVVIAAAAVVGKIALTPQVSWVTFAICVGYPVYFILRRRHRLDGPVAFGGEMLVLAPVVLVAMATADPASSAPATLAGLAGVGLFTAAAMAGYLAAARLLTLPVFGLASYVEPVLLVVVSLLLGESFHGAGDLFVYLAIALALAVLALDGLRAMRTLPRPRP